MNRYRYARNLQPQDWRIDSHKSLDDFASSIAAGCSTCSLLAPKLQHVTEGSDPSRLSEPPKLLDVQEEHRRTLRSLRQAAAKELEREDSRDTVNEGISVDRIRFAIECNGLASQSLGNNTGGATSFRYMQLWLNKCDAVHTACKTAGKSWHPTRLLKVTEYVPVVGPHLLLIRLVNIPASAKAPYTALSHCWGGTAPFILTHATHAKLRKGIAVKKLPKTFQHAASVALRFNLHLWIDSLCILQDSADDWQRQASAMPRIYASAYFTLAATAASNSAEGLFFQRQAPVGSDEDIFANDIEGAPLYRRAWAVQERYVSNRMIHFGREQIFWECQCLRACESLPTGVDGNLHRRVTRTRISNEPVSALFQTWNDIVMLYSNAKLTYRTDKLLALAGVARMIAGVTKDRYLAGMWKEDIVLQLPWYVKNPVKETIDRYTALNGQYVAPSWSWAAANSGVVIRSDRVSRSWGLIDLKREALVTDMWTREENRGDKFGQIGFGHLLISGLLLFTKISFTEATDASQDRECYHMSFHDVSDDNVIRTEAFLDMDRSLLHPVYTLLLLFHTSEERRQNVTDGFGDATGLFIERIFPNERVFRRVGAWHMRFRNAELEFGTARGGQPRQWWQRQVLLI